MAKFSPFKIDLKNLPEGINTFSYELDQRFFDSIDDEGVRKGKVQVDLTVKKANEAFEFNFHLEGTVQIPCDRCLDEMDQEIETDNRLIVKFGEEHLEVTDEIIIIPEEEGGINIAWFLYEFIILNIPIRHVHMPGKCNKGMTKKYRQHQAVSTSNDSDDDDNPADEFDNGDIDDDIDATDSTQTTDPRWDELKKLKE